MKKTIIITLVLIISGLAANASNWRLDKKYSSLTFSIPHLKIGKLNGYISNFDINMQARQPDFRDAQMTLSIDVNSAISYNVERDSIMKSEKFLNTKKYPTIHFKSDWIETINENLYSIHGNLTVRGITKEAIFTVEYKGTVYDPELDEDTAIFIITAAINRTEFGLEMWQKDIMGNFIQLVANVEMLQ